MVDSRPSVAIACSLTCHGTNNIGCGCNMYRLLNINQVNIQYYGNFCMSYCTVFQSSSISFFFFVTNQKYSNRLSALDVTGSTCLFCLSVVFLVESGSTKKRCVHYMCFDIFPTVSRLWVKQSWIFI